MEFIRARFKSIFHCCDDDFIYFKVGFLCAPFESKKQNSRKYQKQKLLIEHMKNGIFAQNIVSRESLMDMIN